jgi:C-terminal processing protease CtpA/Prc
MSSLLKYKDVKIGDVIYKVDGRSIEILKVEKIAIKYIHCKTNPDSPFGVKRQLDEYDFTANYYIFKNSIDAATHVMKRILTNDLSMDIVDVKTGIIDGLETLYYSLSKK